jgi:hypothetical protein
MLLTLVTIDRASSGGLHARRSLKGRSLARASQASGPLPGLSSVALVVVLAGEAEALSRPALPGSEVARDGD